MMRGACIGIDLGTTNSVVAGVRDDKIQVFADAEGHRLHPSVVAFTPKSEIVVGLRARMRRIIDPRNTVFSAKRIIGQPFRAPDVQTAIANLPFRVEEGPNQEPFVVTRGGRHSVPNISSMVLAHLKTIAERALGQPVTHCVITVPANFTDSQREATRRAGDAAGMTVLRVLNEPTAAALAYGQGQNLEQRFVVFDFGGGTFDITLLAVRGDIFEVITTGGDPYLGGDDMDKAVAEYFAMQFLQKHRIDLRADPDAYAKLLVICEQVKMRLSGADFVQDSVAEIAYGLGGEPLPLELDISRAQFESLIEPFVDRALNTTRKVMESAGVHPGAVDEVLLAGGATKIPLVARKVGELFGRAPRSTLSPMEVVAMGAAIHAVNLVTPAGDAPTAVLMDVTSHALGIATTAGYAEQLIAKNTPIPTECTRVFTTAKSGQTSVRIRVCQGESTRFGENVEVGEVRLANLRTTARGQVRIEVTFLVDANGICSVIARDVETDQTAEATLTLLGLASAVPVGG